MNQTASPTVADPFAIGWRDVIRTLPDGSPVTERVPLTLNDALHPREGDTFVINSAHNRFCRHIQDVFEHLTADDPHALVLGDCKLLWADGVHHSPDIAVYFGVRAVKDYYGQFDAAAEGVGPSLILEVVSPSTRVNDIEAKLEDYHHYGVPFYVIVDREREEAVPTLIGYRRTKSRYLPMAAYADGRLWLEPLGVFLGVRDDRVALYDGDTERELGDYSAVADALAAAEERADAEYRRRTAAEERAEAAEIAWAADRDRLAALEARIRLLEAVPDGQP